MLSSHLEKTLRDAYNLAYKKEHEFVILEEISLERQCYLISAWIGFAQMYVIIY